MSVRFQRRGEPQQRFEVLSDEPMVDHQPARHQRWWLAIGAVLASLAWFAGLGLRRRFAYGLLDLARTRQVPDMLLVVTMLAIAASLARG